MYTVFSYAVVAGTILLLSTIFRSFFDYSKLDQLLVTPLSYRQALWFSNRKILQRLHFYVCIAMWFFSISAAFIYFPFVSFFFSSVLMGIFLYYRYLFIFNKKESVPQFINPFGKEFLPFFSGTVLIQMLCMFCFGAMDNPQRYFRPMFTIVFIQTSLLFFWHLINYLEMVRKIEGHMRD